MAIQPATILSSSVDPIGFNKTDAVLEKLRGALGGLTAEEEDIIRSYPLLKSEFTDQTANYNLGSTDQQNVDFSHALGLLDPFLGGQKTRTQKIFQSSAAQTLGDITGGLVQAPLWANTQLETNPYLVALEAARQGKEIDVGQPNYRNIPGVGKLITNEHGQLDIPEQLYKKVGLPALGLSSDYNREQDVQQSGLGGKATELLGGLAGGVAASAIPVVGPLATGAKLEAGLAPLLGGASSRIIPRVAGTAAASGVTGAATQLPISLGLQAGQQDTDWRRVGLETSIAAGLGLTLGGTIKLADVVLNEGTKAYPILNRLGDEVTGKGAKLNEIAASQATDFMAQAEQRMALKAEAQQAAEQALEVKRIQEEEFGTNLNEVLMDVEGNLIDKPFTQEQLGEFAANQYLAENPRDLELASYMKNQPEKLKQVTRSNQQKKMMRSFLEWRKTQDELATINPEGLDPELKAQVEFAQQNPYDVNNKNILSEYQVKQAEQMKAVEEQRMAQMKVRADEIRTALAVDRAAKEVPTQQVPPEVQQVINEQPWQDDILLSKQEGLEGSYQRKSGGLEPTQGVLKTPTVISYPDGSYGVPLGDNSGIRIIKPNIETGVYEYSPLETARASEQVSLTPRAAKKQAKALKYKTVDEILKARKTKTIKEEIKQLQEPIREVEEEKALLEDIVGPVKDEENFFADRGIQPMLSSIKDFSKPIHKHVVNYLSSSHLRKQQWHESSSNWINLIKKLPGDQQAALKERLVVGRDIPIETEADLEFIQNPELRKQIFNEFAQGDLRKMLDRAKDDLIRQGKLDPEETTKYWYPTTFENFSEVSKILQKNNIKVKDLEAKLEGDLGRELTEVERQKLLESQFVPSTGATKGRTLSKELRQGLLNFYADPIKTLDRFINDTADTTTFYDVFDNLSQPLIVDGQIQKADWATRYVDNMLKAGDFENLPIKNFRGQTTRTELIKMLQKVQKAPRTNYDGASGAISTFRKWAQVGTFANPDTALSQLEDIPFMMVTNNPGEVIQAGIQTLLNQSNVTLKQLGLQHVMRDIGTPSGFRNALFELGLTAPVDRTAKQIRLNLATVQAKNAFKPNSKSYGEFKKKWSEFFTKEGWKQFEADFKKDELTDSVANYYYNALNEMHPLSHLDRPAAANIDSPAGELLRTVYDGKSFTFKRNDYIRNNFYRPWLDAKKAGDYPELVRQSARTAKFLLLMGIAKGALGTARTALKGQVAGSLGGAFVKGVIAQTLFDPYQIDKAASGDLEGAVGGYLGGVGVSSLAPLAQDLADVGKRDREGLPKFNLATARSWRKIPIVGGYYDAWFGRSHARKIKELESGSEPTKRRGVTDDIGDVIDDTLGLE